MGEKTAFERENKTGNPMLEQVKNAKKNVFFL